MGLKFTALERENAQRPKPSDFRLTAKGWLPPFSSFTHDVHDGRVCSRRPEADFNRLYRSIFIDPERRQRPRCRGRSRIAA